MHSIGYVNFAEVNTDSAFDQQSTEDPEMATQKQPSKTKVRSTRLSAGLTVAESASIIDKAPRTWRAIETGTFKMQADDWATFCSEIERRAESGELIVANNDWVPVSEAARFLGRSRMYVARLVDQEKVRRKMKNPQLALYNKSDLRKVKKALSSKDKAVVKAESKHYSRDETIALVGSLSRLEALRDAGHLAPVKDAPGVYFSRSDVDSLVERIEKEEALLTTSEVATELGITRQGVSAMLKRMEERGETDVTPVVTVFGRQRFTEEMVSILADRKATSAT
ncbi:winged helix-turn-helix transcriptional regulator [Marinimicrobium sp. ABcell2]|uniref:winged helix-turn-helix transcriptional regulator n=1 Tax=Marinimicrobium sp. ABcell2 TaxID=3069751 RepID=UPI0027B60CE2|nr:winged helix-turn-helix transcriptional regulator [Marinimicrobium sp. ABcell2]MDQ2077418.1 winged helix-turn-helix transcriptional regulator [Marinimicrobium sp. ABcell2]